MNSLQYIDDEFSLTLSKLKKTEYSVNFVSFDHDDFSRKPDRNAKHASIILSKKQFNFLKSNKYKDVSNENKNENEKHLKTLISFKKSLRKKQNKSINVYKNMISVIKFDVEAIK